MKPEKEIKDMLEHLCMEKVLWFINSHNDNLSKQLHKMQKQIKDLNQEIAQCREYNESLQFNLEEALSTNNALWTINRNLTRHNETLARKRYNPYRRPLVNLFESSDEE